MAIKDYSAVYKGDQLQAAGILFVALDTKNILTVYRGVDVVDPCCWCSVGGKVEDGETPEQTARREASEEIGYSGPLQLIPAFVYNKPGLLFHNFIGVVDEQFYPKLNWESHGYAWTLKENVPHPWHYGLEAMLTDSATVLSLDSALNQEYREDMPIRHLSAVTKKPTTDDPVYVARRVDTLFKTRPLPPAVKKSPEPYRAALYHLGYEHMDGTKWWDRVMEQLN